MKTANAFLVLALLVQSGVACEHPRKSPGAPDPIPGGQSDPDGPIPDPDAGVGTPIGPIAASGGFSGVAGLGGGAGTSIITASLSATSGGVGSR